MPWSKDPLRKYGIEVKEKWYEHKLGVVMENDKCKILWDFTVQTGREIYGKRPDVIVVQKDKNLCQTTDFACPYDGTVDTKELEKNRTLPRFGTRVEKDRI